MNKPGLKSSEFWMATVVVSLGAVASVYAEAEWAKAVGMIAAALASAGYGFSRARVKGAEVEGQYRVEENRDDNQAYTEREQIQANKEMQIAALAASKEQS
jgi:Ser/Thr protein kinase RdoA (MazF antagonist)